MALGDAASLLLVEKATHLEQCGGSGMRQKRKSKEEKRSVFSMGKGLQQNVSSRIWYLIIQGKMVTSEVQSM